MRPDTRLWSLIGIAGVWLILVWVQRGQLQSELSTELARMENSLEAMVRPLQQQLLEQQQQLNTVEGMVRELGTRRR